MEEIQRERVVDEAWEYYKEHQIKIQSIASEEKNNRVKKDRKYQDLDREYKRAVTEDEQERIKAKLEKREEELSNRAADAVIDRGPHPRGCSPSDLLDEARKQVGAPCYKINCDMRTNEIECIKIE